MSPKSSLEHRHSRPLNATDWPCYYKVARARNDKNCQEGVGGAAWQWHGGLLGLSGMICETRPRSPLVPQVCLERGRAQPVKAVAPRSPSKGRCRCVEAKTRKDCDEGTKGPSPTRGCLRGFVQRVPRAAAPPCQPRGRVGRILANNPVLGTGL